jgi:L-lactate utilization protein LutB
LSIKELKHLLALAEKEIVIKNRKIESLEEYIEQLDSKIGTDGDTVDKEFIM